MGLNKIKKYSYLGFKYWKLYVSTVCNEFFLFFSFVGNEMKNCKIIFLNKSAMKSYQHGTV